MEVVAVDIQSDLQSFKMIILTKLLCLYVCSQHLLLINACTVNFIILIIDLYRIVSNTNKETCNTFCSTEFECITKLFAVLFRNNFCCMQMYNQRQQSLGVNIHFYSTILISYNHLQDVIICFTTQQEEAPIFRDVLQFV